MSTAALSAARGSRKLAASRQATRTLATESHPSSSTSSPTDGIPRPGRAHRGRDKEELNKRHLMRRWSNNSVYVRAWDSINSMPEFFAMLRGVEKRFGRVREFRVGRDADISTAYPSFFICDFQDEEAFMRVPPKGTNIKVQVPVIKADMPGGVGLAELNGLLHSRNFDWEEGSQGLYGAAISPLGSDTSTPTRTVELIVQPTKNMGYEAIETKAKVRIMGFGAAFYSWGGFYQPTSEDQKPISPEMTKTLDKWRGIAHEYFARRGEDPPDPRAARFEQEGASAAAATTEGAEAAAGEASAEAGEGQGKPESENNVERAWRDMVQRASRPRDPLAEMRHPTPSSPSPAADAQTPTADAEAKTSEAAPAEPPRTPRLTKKQKILELARQHARTPLPDTDAKPAEEPEVEEKVEEKQDTATVRQRLLNLMGGWR